jgi:uncharacterized DUF497 family protein
MATARFDWDSRKDAENQRKHGVSFAIAQYAFADPRRVIAKDISHSQSEERFYCFGEGSRWRSYGTVHVSCVGDSHHRGRLLAQRNGTL